MKKLYYLAVCPLKESLFLCLLLINGICNLIPARNFSLIIETIGLTFFETYVEVLIYQLIPNKIIKTLWISLIIFVSNVLLIIQCFLFLHFTCHIGQEMVDILCDTNTREIADFTKTYILSLKTLALIVSVSFLNILYFYLVKTKSKRVFGSTVICLSLCLTIYGFYLCGHSIYGYVFYNNGYNIPMKTGLSSLLKSSANIAARYWEVKKCLKLSERVRCTPNKVDSTIIIFVIGESHSIYHSSLYGYPKQTQPNLTHRKDSGELFVLEDVISFYDRTHRAMESIFSLSNSPDDYSSSPLFPVLFRKAGFKTYCFDNQYFIDEGVTFLADRDLSNAMFNYRNEAAYDYDGEMINNIPLPDSKKSNCLYIIHLLGQHFVYRNRYPLDFERFNLNNYDEMQFSDAQRDIIAAYDNAMLYNDYVIESLIRKFRDYKAVLVYTSDHGEEVFELRDYMGHGNASTVNDKNYQIRVPLYIWMSDKYRKEHQSQCESLREAKNFHITTDDISHFYLILLV